MEPVEVRFEGLEELLKQLEAYPEKTLTAAASELQIFANELLNASLALVPVDRGLLRSTGHVQPVVREGETLYVQLGYGGPAAPYALSVHENPRAGKTGGVSPQGFKYKHYAQVGEWKYLETPFNALIGTLPERLKQLKV